MDNKKPTVKNRLFQPNSFMVSMGVLVLSIVLVHLFYVGYVQPNAAKILQSGLENSSRNFFVIIKDMEQEVSIIAMFWCCYLILSKVIPLINDKGLFTHDFLASFEKDGSIDLTEALKVLEKSEYKDKPLLQTWISCIHRFNFTHDVQNASDALQASVESLSIRMEAGNSMIRYLIWMIPSIGFIGTVRGIGQALAQADDALAGNIAGMTDSLGVAFNSTFVALLISILLMFLLHQLQKLQDEQVVDIQSHCEKYLLKHLYLISAKAT